MKVPKSTFKYCGELQLTRFEGQTLYFLLGRSGFKVDGISEKDIGSFWEFSKKMHDAHGYLCWRPVHVKRNRVAKWWEREIAFAKAYETKRAQEKAAEPNEKKE